MKKMIKLIIFDDFHISSFDFSCNILVDNENKRKEGEEER
jgi:hypothetical protein